ncbi:MAG TPA: hypothetical protein VJ965_12265, partial [Anaerolineales bacterium]|nr:hypothetical protein [Anaerolineales bacterium]
MSDFLKFSGYINFAAGVMLILFWYLYAILLPYGELSDTLSILVLDKNWGLVNVLGVAGSLLGLLGLVGLYLKVIETTGRLGLAGFVLAFLGT